MLAGKRAGIGRALALHTRLIAVGIAKLAIVAVFRHLKGLIHELLLATENVTQLLQHLSHRRHFALRAVLGNTGLQIAQNLFQPRQQFLGGFVGAAPGKLLDRIEHAVQILSFDHLPRPALLVPVGLLVAAGLVHHGAQVSVKRLAQALHQLGNFLRGSVLSQRFLESLARRQKIAHRLGDIALLDGKRHLPEELDRGLDVIVRLGPVKPIHGGANPEINAAVLKHALRPNGEGLEQADHFIAVVGAHHELAAKFDQRLGQGLGEFPLRQLETLELAFPGLAGVITGENGHFNHEAGPRMGGQILYGLAVRRLGGGLRQLNREVGRTEEEHTIGGQALAIFLLVGKAEAGLQGNHAIVVASGPGKSKGVGGGRSDVARYFSDGRGVGNQRNAPGVELTRAFGDNHTDGTVERHLGFMNARAFLLAQLRLENRLAGGAVFQRLGEFQIWRAGIIETNNKRRILGDDDLARLGELSQCFGTGEKNRRLAGIIGRGDPGVESGRQLSGTDRRHGGLELGTPVAAFEHDQRNKGDSQAVSQRIGIAAYPIGARQACLQRSYGGCNPPAVLLP